MRPASSRRNRPRLGGAQVPFAKFLKAFEAFKKFPEFRDWLEAGHYVARNPRQRKELEGSSVNPHKMRVQAAKDKAAVHAESQKKASAAAKNAAKKQELVKALLALLAD